MSPTMSYALTKLAVLGSLAASTFAAPAPRIPQEPQARQDNAIPQFALDHAPLIWIQSEDPYFPGPISAALQNEHPVINRVAVENAPSPLTLDNLDQLNGQPSRVSLQSNEDLTTFPAWFNGAKPDADGKTAGDPSAVIVTADKGNGVLDVFYLFWYPFNRGNEVFGDDAGNHVGDWEHVAIRFENGSPKQVYMSQHANGQAFSWDAVEKQGNRPVGYSAKGSHATYATTGTHDHTIPGLNLPFDFFLTDVCDQGTLWDPAANAYFYSYDVGANKFATYSNSADAPTAWLYYTGAWGDEELPKEDPRQHYFLGIKLTAKWTGGPSGPIDKSLGRKNICPDGKDCKVSPILLPREAEAEAGAER